MELFSLAHEKAIVTGGGSGLGAAIAGCLASAGARVVICGAPLSQPVQSWDGKTPPAKDVLDLLNRAGTDLAPWPGTPEGDRLKVQEVSGQGDRVLCARGTGPRVRAHAPACHVGRTRRAIQRRAPGLVLRRRHAVQSRRTRAPRQGFPRPHPLRRWPRTPGVLLPDAVLQIRTDRTRR